MAISIAAQPYALTSRAPSRHLVPQKAQHFWVLHKKLISRGLVGLLCAGLIAGTFQARGGILAAAETISHVMSGRLASAGFAIDEITISGQSITSERQIVAALQLDPESSTLGFDADLARGRVEALPGVLSAEVRKVYPNGVDVTVVEAVPAARHWIDGQTYLIDASGRTIAGALSTDADLPLVIGFGAGDDALPMIRALGRYTLISEGLVALSRVGDRRWDLVYASGLHVQLPEVGVGQALAHLAELEADHQILARDLDVIDLRVAGEVVVQITERDAENS